MFIDYVSLMLTNMTAGLILLACYVLVGRDRPQGRWVPGFAMVGLVALVAGFAMVLSWPIPAQVGHAYNAVYGESTVLLGVLFLGAALTLAKGWGWTSVAIYAAVAGLIGMVLGVRILDLWHAGIRLSLWPGLTGTGFILTGAGGELFALSAACRSSKALRVLTGVVLLASAGIWLFNALTCYWMHMKMWLPGGA